jgi:hypothetical protein
MLERLQAKNIENKLLSKSHNQMANKEIEN